MSCGNPYFSSMNLCFYQKSIQTIYPRTILSNQGNDPHIDIFCSQCYRRSSRYHKINSLNNFQRLLLVFAAFVAFLDGTNGDFHYPDFNQTLGLTFNGDATTSNCGLNNTYITSRFDGIRLKNISESNIKDQVVSHISQEDGLQTKKTVVTNDDSSETSDISKLYAQFGHKDTFQSNTSNGCSTRLRLTPSAPSKVGSVWYEKRVPVVRFIHASTSSKILRLN